MAIAVIAAACSSPEYTIPRESEIGGMSNRGGAGSSGATSIGGADSVGGSGPLSGTAGIGTAGNGTAGVGTAGSGTAGNGPGVAVNCLADADCAANHATRTCDTAAGLCVECLPGRTPCGNGLYCDIEKECHVGCAANADCTTGTCDVATHLCTGCNTNADCTIGTRCDVASQVCVAGCDNATSCPTGFTCCANACVNLYLDESNCGSCTSSCGRSNAQVSCREAVCLLDGCKEGYRDCNGKVVDGCEVTSLTDPNNCGNCGNLCSLSHASASCAAGACTVAVCATGWADCNGLPGDGCEVNLVSDAAHCGGCDKACSSTNGTPSCSLGECAITCLPGFGNCDDAVANGCEVDVNVSVANCATCGHQCPAPANGSATCDRGTCGVSSCVAPYADCDKNTSNGCESNAKSDVNNCGGCGSPCTLAHATATCSNGACAIASCAAGWGDCDGVVTNGCEVNLLSSLTHCGSCNVACAPADAVPACLAGKCSIASCSSGYQDCNKDVKDGCEVNTQTSVANCGGCGAACSAVHGTPSCNGGNCSIVCAAGYGNCDGDIGTGCETSTTSSVNHCSGCGKPCSPQNGTGACQNSACVIASCNADYQDCDATYSTGCEVNTATDTSNCRTCRNVCNATNGTPTCAATGCNITCNTGYADCTTAAGCETNVFTDEANCGACGRTCNTTCTNGICATPCTGLCSNPTVFTIAKPNPYHSPALGTSSVCYETTSAIAGGGCSNFATGRTISVNGVAQTCGSWSNLTLRNGGFCIQIGAGLQDYASFDVW